MDEAKRFESGRLGSFRVLVLLLLAGCECGPIVPCLSSTSNPCTERRVVDGECVERPIADGSACSLGRCTDTRCVGGRCVGTLPEPFNQCQFYVDCFTVSENPGMLCDDGDPCTVNDRCEVGLCTGTSIACDDSDNPCTTSVCDDGGCTEVAVADGTRCADENACNGNEHCVDGACVRECSSICFDDVTGLLLGVRMNGIVGGGATLLDANEDGWLDLVLAGEPDVLHVFQGSESGFERVFTGVVLDAVNASPVHGGPARPQGVIAADFNRDGHEDLFVMMDGPNQLYAGDGTGAFVRSAFDAQPEYTTAAAAADIDGDGWLDLYVGNYIAELREPGTHIPAPNRFYRGSAAGFVEEDLDIAGAGTTLAVLFSDFDRDGDPDLFVCNDFGDTIEPNQLFRNDDGVFEDATSREGARLAFFCMGLAVADYDRDGDRDVFVSNLGDNALLRRLGDRYADVAETAGVLGRPDMCVDAPSTSWAASWVDFDLDGWQDLYVSNGYASYGDSALEDPHRVYRHQRMSFTFEDVSFESGAALAEQGRGAVFGDLDRDGDVDVVQVHSDGPPLVLLNNSPRQGGWLRVELPGRIGTEVTVDLGDARLVRELRRHEGYASGQPAELYFGLGDVESVDVVARYPDGTTDSWSDVAADSVLRVAAPIVESGEVPME